MADDGGVWRPGRYAIRADARTRPKAAEDVVDLQRRNAELRRRNAELESENEQLRRRVQQLEGNHGVLPARRNDAGEESTPRLRLRGGDLNQRDSEAPSRQVVVAAQAAAVDLSRSAANSPSRHTNAAGGEEGAASVAVLDRHDQKWNARYCELETFKAQHGHCNVPQSHGTLGRWVTSQRTKRKDDRLPQERVQQLDALGFDWSPRSTIPTWDDSYGQLKAFLIEHGHCNVPQSHGPLGIWVTSQRTKRKKENLTEERVEKLDDLGFNWGTGTFPTWDERHDELKAFVIEHSHCNVSESHGPLGDWVRNQRKYRKEDKLSRDRVDKLDHLGFNWDISRRTRLNLWEDRYEDLKEYKAEHGHCKVPTNHGPLGGWVNNQRQARKKGKLSEDHVRNLDDLDFNWGSSAQPKWQDHYNELREYKAEQGHCNVPQSQGPLGKWVVNQRQARKQGKVSDDRVRNLDDLGFSWGSTQPKWQDRYNELREYKAEHGHCNVPQSQGPLGGWVTLQRWNRKKGKLSEDRVQKLDGIGFVWATPPGARSARPAQAPSLLVAARSPITSSLTPSDRSSSGSHRRRIAKEKRNTLRAPRCHDADEKLKTPTPLVCQYEQTWNERLDELAKYKAAHGHCNVPASQGYLGNWVQNQRTFRKYAKLSEEQIQNLNDLGFDWAVQMPAVVSLELRN